MKLDHNNIPTCHKRIHRIDKRGRLVPSISYNRTVWWSHQSEYWTTKIWNLISNRITSTCNLIKYFMLWTWLWSHQPCSSSNLIRFDVSYTWYQIWNIFYTDYKISNSDIKSYRKLIRYIYEHIKINFLVRSYFDIVQNFIKNQIWKSIRTDWIQIWNKSNLIIKITTLKFC